MSASIIRFRSRSKSAETCQSERPWTNQEMAELYRVRDQLVASGMDVETDSGMTDEGDAWFVYEHVPTNTVVVHITRLDGLLHVVNCLTRKAYKGISFRDVSDRMLNDAVMQAGSRLRNAPKVTLHPKAFLTAFVAAAIMLLDAEHNSEANAVSLAPDLSPEPSNLETAHDPDGLHNGQTPDEVERTDRSDAASFNIARRFQLKDTVAVASSSNSQQSASHTLSNFFSAEFVGLTAATVLGAKLFADELAREFDREAAIAPKGQSNSESLELGQPGANSSNVHTNLDTARHDSINKHFALDHIDKLIATAVPADSFQVLNPEIGTHLFLESSKDSFAQAQHGNRAAEFSDVEDVETAFIERDLSSAASQSREASETTAAETSNVSGSAVAKQTNAERDASAESEDEASSSAASFSGSPFDLFRKDGPTPIAPDHVVDYSTFLQDQNAKSMVETGDSGSDEAFYLPESLAGRFIYLEHAIAITALDRELTTQDVTIEHNALSLLSPQNGKLLSSVMMHDYGAQGFKTEVDSLAADVVDIVPVETHHLLIIENFTLGQDILAFNDASLGKHMLTHFYAEGDDIVLTSGSGTFVRLVGVLTTDSVHPGDGFYGHEA